jgi:hypothetical protein
LTKANAGFKPSDLFNGIKLLQAWLIVIDASADAGIAGSRFTWNMWESGDIKGDGEC